LDFFIFYFLYAHLVYVGLIPEKLSNKTFFLQLKKSSAVRDRAYTVATRFALFGEEK